MASKNEQIIYVGRYLAWFSLLSALTRWIVLTAIHNCNPIEINLGENQLVEWEIEKCLGIIRSGWFNVGCRILLIFQIIASVLFMEGIKRKVPSFIQIYRIYLLADGAASYFFLTRFTILISASIYPQANSVAAIDSTFFTAIGLVTVISFIIGATIVFFYMSLFKMVAVVGDAVMEEGSQEKIGNDSVQFTY